jgi:sugar phosphate isomerase/epimerase
MHKTWSWSTTGYTFLGKTHEQIHGLCLQAGLAGIEAAVEMFPTETLSELEAIGRQYRQAGLRIDSFHLPFVAEDDIACFYETTRQRAVDRMRKAMEQAAALGARVCIQHPSTNRFNMDDEGGVDPYLRQIGKSLKALLAHAEGLGLNIALENMLPAQSGPRLGSEPRHFALFAREFGHPHLGFCLDTGHALVAAGPQRAHEFFQAMAPHLAAFHLADNAGDRDSHLAPGRGLVDWNFVFRAAAEIGYSHPMCIETPPFAPGPDYSPQAWESLVAQADALVQRALEH